MGEKEKKKKLTTTLVERRLGNVRRHGRYGRDERL
jgi:hypothetical protein